MISYEEIAKRVTIVANTLNGGSLHPNDIQQMRALVVCYDHLNETVKLIQEAINEKALESTEEDSHE